MSPLLIFTGRRQHSGLRPRQVEARLASRDPTSLTLAFRLPGPRIDSFFVS